MLIADYEVLDNSGIDGPRRSRLRREQGRPLLFEKFEFCLLGNDFSSFITKEKLRALLMSCGGSVVRSVAHMSFARGIVCLAIVDKGCPKFYSLIFKLHIFIQHFLISEIYERNPSLAVNSISEMKESEMSDLKSLPGWRRRTC